MLIMMNTIYYVLVLIGIIVVSEKSEAAIHNKQLWGIEMRERRLANKQIKELEEFVREVGITI